MKYLGYLIIVMCALFILSIVHNILLRMIWYRWLVNSILYPYWSYKLSKFDYYKAIDVITYWEIHPKWFHDFWFGRKLKKQLLDKIEKEMQEFIKNYEL